MRSLLLFHLTISLLSAAKVAIFSIPLSKSHVIFNNLVAEELAEQHDVVIIRPNANPNASSMISKHPRVHEIRPSGADAVTMEAFKAKQDKFVWEGLSLFEMIDFATATANMTQQICDSYLEEATFSRIRAAKFDVALANVFEFCTISVIHAAGIPSWGYYIPAPLLRPLLSNMGIPVLVSTYPTIMLDAGNAMTTVQRLKNFVIELFLGYAAPYMLARPVDALFRSKFGDDFPPNSELAQQAKFMISNANPDIEFPIPVTSAVMYLRGLGTDNRAKQLQEPYASFVGNAKRVVYASFGSVAEPTRMPEYLRDVFVELFNKNPDIHFIWSMDNRTAVPSNVLKSAWHPQKDLLAHPKVAAFITHAGYNSLTEAASSATPLVAIPLFGDQFRNSHLMEHRKFGVRVDRDGITFEKLNEALHQVLDDPKYARAAKAMQSIGRSSPIAAGDALRHAVNFVLEHPLHDRRLPALPLYQLYSLDMIAIVFGLPLFVPLLLKWYYWSCCRMAYKEKEKIN